MKRDKSRCAQAYKKYIAPSVLLLAPLAGACIPEAADAAISFHCNCSSDYNGTCGWAPSLGTYECTSKVGLKLGTLVTGQIGDVVCISRHNIIQNIFTKTGCKGYVVATAGVHTYRAAKSGARSLMLLTKAYRTATTALKNTTLTNTPPALKLAKITLHITITELNNIPGGVHVSLGGPIPASELTEEQRTVLMNHRGLIREALRQLKAWKAEETVPVSG